MIAALFVDAVGIYSTIEGVDPWGIERDARTYPGPHAVVAHPPCERWGRYWFGGPSCKTRKRKGDDSGCFASALASVRRWGGVLEHPAYSSAWQAFGLSSPPLSGGWVSAGDWVGWTCHVEQGHYGHRARKATWLYAARIELPSLRWGKSSASYRLDDGFHSSAERAAAKAAGWVAGPRIPTAERAATPPAFAELLVSIARTSTGGAS